MKSTNDIQKDINEVIKEAEAADTERQKNSLLKKLPVLRCCLLYLETNPNESFIQSEIEKITEKINTRVLLFDADKYEKLVKSEVNKIRKAFETEYEIPKLRLQLKALNYLL